MRKKSFLAFALFCLSTSARAATTTCPTVVEIKSSILHNWKPVDINDGAPLSASRFSLFQHTVKTFALAEWMNDAPEGSGHCYYNGNEPDQIGINAFLAKPNMIVDNAANAWQQIDEDNAQCRAESEKCLFK